MFNIKPMDGSDVAVLWDHLYGFLVGLSVFFFILVVGGMLYFVWKYRDKPGAKAKYIVDNHKLEIIWTIIPTILLLVIFAWGYSVYKSMIDAPSGAMEVRVVGKQWLWQFQYDDGRMSVGELIVPVNKPVKLIMSSEDVLHSFFVPNFRIKQDVVPGIYTTAWFEAKVTGVHHIFCTEYCGAPSSRGS
jgi:cytochrome c oxidase subunit 2